MANWNHSELAQLAGYEDSRSFSRELSRKAFPIRPLDGSLRVKASRYSDIGAAKALIFGRLRSLGMTVERAAQMLRSIDENELAFVLDDVGHSRPWVAFCEQNGAVKCALGLGALDLGALLKKLGGNAVTIDLGGTWQ